MASLWGNPTWQVELGQPVREALAGVSRSVLTMQSQNAAAALSRTLSQAIDPAVYDMSRRFSRSLLAGSRPLFDFGPALDFGSVFSDSMVESFRESTRHLVEYLERMRKLQRDLAPDTLPQNLQEHATTPEARALLYEVLFDDGIPLAFALSTETVGAVVRAPNRAARIERLWSRRKGILSRCADGLDSVTAAHLGHSVELARQALEAYQHGLHGPAQAQAMAIVDTHYTSHAPQATANAVKHARPMEHLQGKVDHRAFPVHAPIARAYARKYQGSPTQEREAEDPPRELSRHATIHGTHPNQYTKRNALQALVMVTSLLRLLQDEHRRAAFSRS